MIPTKLFTAATALISLTLAAPSTPAELGSSLEAGDNPEIICSRPSQNLAYAEMTACCDNMATVGTQSISGDGHLELCSFGTTVVSAVSLDGQQATLRASYIEEICEAIQLVCENQGGATTIYAGDNFGIRLMNHH